MAGIARRWWFRAVVVIGLFLIVAGFFLAGSESDIAAASRKVRQGMTVQEVENAIGGKLIWYSHRILNPNNGEFKPKPNVMASYGQFNRAPRLFGNGGTYLLVHFKTKPIQVEYEVEYTEMKDHGPETRGVLRRGVVDSSLYSTTSMVRTIELMLGLRPMSQFDAAARPMYASFQSKPDSRPYQHLKPKTDLAERNKPDAYGAALSEKFDLTKADAVDDLLLNDVIWHSVRGTKSPMPAPVRAAFFIARSKADKDEKDD